MHKCIMEESPMGEQMVDIFSKLEEQRTYFIHDEITDAVASYVTSCMLMDDNESQEDPIQLIINSPGGDIRNIFMIYDTMMMIRCPIITLVTGEAGDEAVLIGSAGTKGKRFATSHASFILDKIRHYGVSYSDLTDVSITQKRLKISNDLFLKAIATHTKIKKPSEFLSEKKYLNAELALKHGLIDKIMKGKK